MAGTSTALLDQSILIGLSRFMDAVDDPERYAGRWMQMFAQGFVPYSGMLRNISNAVDPVLRKPEGILEGVQSVIPGQSEGLRPRLDRFGEPATRYGPWWLRGFVVPMVSRPIEDDVTLAMDKAGFRPTMPSGELTDGGERLALTGEQEDLLTFAIGRERKFRVSREVRRTGFANRSLAYQLERMEDASRDASRAVRARARRAFARGELTIDRLDRLVSRDVLMEIARDHDEGKALLGGTDRAVRGVDRGAPLRPAVGQ